MRKILFLKNAVVWLTCFSIMASPVLSQQTDGTAQAKKNVAMTRIAVKYGPQVVKQLRKKTSFSVPQSSLSKAERSVAVEKTYQKYVEMRSAYASAQNAGEWLSLGVGGSAALVAAVAGPQATVTIPALLVGAALTTLIDVGNEELEAVSQIQLRRFLKSKEQEILANLGLSFEEMKADPEKAKEAFADGVQVFQDLRDRAGGDEAVWKQSQDLLVQTIVNTDRAQWDAIQQNHQDIELVADFVVDLAEDLEAFKSEVNDKFEALETAFESISSAVVDLEVAVVDLDNRVVNLERDQSVIVDFIFDQMPPDQKVRALRDRDFMASRFACPEDQDTCERSDLREAMIVRFEEEAELQGLLETATTAIGTLNTVGKIANDLNIASPELNEALRIGNAAFGAFTGFMTGNYLGAISSVTGLFAKKSDPDAERFKIMMMYLQQQFKQINAKLDAVLENQVKIVEALNSLSEQMQKGFLRVERKLANLEFEQRRTSLGVRQLIWDDWKTCYSVYKRATRQTGGSFNHLDPTTLYFKDERAMVEVRSNVGQAALQCLVTMQTNMDSLSATKRFGNFVDLQWVIDERLTTAATLPDGDSDEWRSLLMRYQQDVFTPARARLNLVVQTDEMFGYADTFARLARPMATTDEWRTGIEFVAQNNFDCENTEALDARLASLLCSFGGSPPDQAAARLLDSPILADVVNDIADWVLVMAQFADVRDQNAGKWISYDDLLSLAEAGSVNSESSTGELMVESAVSVVDLAIASYAMIYGPDVAEELMRELNSGDEALAASAIDLATANPFLAQNTVQLLLESRFAVNFPDARGPRPSKTGYRAAYDLASKNAVGQFLLLEGLFGSDIKFTLTEDGDPSIDLSVGDKKLVVPLPAPGQMVRGQLKWPARYYELLATREQLADRLIGYRLLDGLEQNEQIYMTELMTRVGN